MPTPHPLAALIKAWADGAVIQCRNIQIVGATWKDLDGPGGDNQPAWLTGGGVEYRIKPANVERYCPVIRMTAGSVVIGEGKVSKNCALGQSGALKHERVVGVVHLTLNPDTLELVSATLEKP